MNASKSDYAKYIQTTADLFLDALQKEGQNTAAYQSLPHLSVPQDFHLPKATTPWNVLLVSPHPDDECLMGGYALRMQEEWGAKIHVVALSYGSNLKRQAERRKELEVAVDALGFELIDPPSRKKNDFSKLEDTGIHEVLQLLKPKVVFSPHADDRHPVHREAHSATHLALDRHWDRSESLLWVQTEFWHPMLYPNVLIPFSATQVIRLGEALQKHVGEVSRNPFHLRLPAWLMDSVRRGSEVVQSENPNASTAQAAVPSVFGQIYHQKILSSN